MAFSLPPRFVEDTNVLIELFHNYEASTVKPQRDEFLRGALVRSCALLSSINLNELKLQLDAIYADATIYEREQIRTMSWARAMFGDGGHFEYFLTNVESGVLRAVGINTVNRDWILKELRTLRQRVLTEVQRLTPILIINAISDLRNDICRLKDQQIMEGQSENNRKKVVKTILVTVIVFNAVGSVVFPPASPAALAASVTLGGVAQYIP
jgi:hypothetical protein